MKHGSFNNYKLHLVETDEEVSQLRKLAEYHKTFGLDTESTGLDFIKDEVVGLCVAFGKPLEGYYLPYRHVIGNNLSKDKVIDLCQYLVSNKKTMWFNRNYDFSMLEKDGLEIPFDADFHDVQPMCWMATNEGFPALKVYTKKFLKYDIIEFADAAKDESGQENHNFGLTDPATSFIYACYSEDTEFLTKDGFKRYTDIKDGEEIYQYNKDNGKIELVRPLKRGSYIADELIEFRGRRSVLKVTPNHRVYFSYNVDRKWQVKQAQELYNRSFRVRTSTEGYEGEERVEKFVFEPSVKKIKDRWGNDREMLIGERLELDPDAFIECLAFYLGDGSDSVRGNQHEFRLCQSTCPEKEDTVEWIDDLNRRLGGLFSNRSIDKNNENRKSNYPMISWTRVHKKLCHWVKDNFEGSGYKAVPEWVFNLSKRQRILFIRAFVRADGSVRDSRDSYHFDVCKNKVLADQLHHLVASVGWSSNMSQYPYEYNGEYGILYRIHICEHLDTASFLKSSSELKHGKFKVGCFTVPSGLLVVRTEGKVCVCGNCFDPVITVLLGRHMWNNYPYIRKIYPLDNRFTEACRRLGQVPVSIDHAMVDKLLVQEEFELRDLKNQIIGITGYEFKLTSNRDKAEALSRFVTLTQKTSKGQFSVKDEVLSAIDHPLAQLLLQYSKKVKFISSYLKPLSGSKDQIVRFNYKTCDVPCLTKESTVLIKDKGVISVSDVKEGDFIWTRYGFKKVLLAEEHLHDCNLIKVTTFYGRSFTGTPWHPVMTESGWVKLKDLKTSDNLLMDIRQVQESYDLNFYKNYNYGRFYVDNLFKGEEFLQKVKPLLDDLYDRFGFTFVWDWVDKDNVSVRIKENDYKPFTRISCLWFLFGLLSIRKSLRNPESLIKKALIACGFSNRNCKTIFDYDSVTTIEVVDPLPVYHIEVEDVHEYVADGLVHHNTGRMASGSQRGNSYYFPLNVQSIPKVSKKRFIHEDPELGYCLNDIEEGSLGKQKVKAGLRDAFCVPKNPDGSSDYFFITADYTSEELNIASNLSGESVIYNAINSGKDLHMEVAKFAFGIEDEAMRDKVKTLNFGCPGRKSFITTNHGLVRPYDLLQGYHKLLNQWGDPQDFINNEAFNKVTYFVEFDNGILEEYHEDHKVQVATKEGRKWVKVKDLTSDMDVLYSVGKLTEFEDSYSVYEGSFTNGVPTGDSRLWNLASKEFAYLAGLYLESGSKSSNGISFSVNSDIEEKFLKCCDSLNLNPIRVDFCYEIKDISFCRLLEKFLGSDKDKHIDDLFYRIWSRSQVAEFIAGLIDSGDTINLCIQNSNKELLNSIAVFLTALGIPTLLKEVSSSLYSLVLLKNSDLIPFSKKNLILEDSKVSSFDNVYTTRVVKKIKSKGSIYGIMCDTHEYLTSSIVSHNTLYGMDKYTLAKRMKVSVDHAMDMMQTYFTKLAKLSRWRQFMINTARRKGMVFTYFGRPRLLYKYYSSSNYQDHAFADRSSINGPVQGEVTLDSRIFTDYGFFTLQEIIDLSEGMNLDSTEQHPYLKVWNGDKFCNFGLYDHGVEEIKEVTLRDGSKIKVGKNHIFKVVTDTGIVDVHISDLKVGDKVLKSLPKQVEFYDEEWSDFDFYTAGRYVGDGYYTNGFIRMCFSLSEVVEARELFSKHYGLGVTKFFIKDDGRSDEEIKSVLPCDGSITKVKNKRGDSAEFQILKPFCKFMLEMGFEEGKNAHTKRIPTSIFKSSLRQRSNFIRGLFDSDGSKTLDSFRWHLCQRGLLEDLQLLLRTCGIRSNIFNSKDGTFLLDVVETGKFSKFIGVEDKERTFKKYGRIQDTISTPKFLENEFLIWYEKNVKPGFYHDWDKDKANRDRSLVCKIRSGKGCGISTFYDLCRDYGYQVNDNYYYSEVKSINKVEDERALCLCLWDESHQYEANGMIHHNCIPTNCMVELKDKVVKLSSIFLDKVVTADNRSAIPSSRGKGMATFTMMQSGDFLVADREHGLLYGNIDKPNYRRICDGLDVDVLTSPLGKKSLSLKSLFYYLFSKQTLKFKFLQKIKSLAAAEKVFYSKDVSTLLFLLNITRFHFHFDSYIHAVNFRTIASLHGYNVVAVNKTTDNTEYKVKRSRKKKVHPIWTKEIGQMSIGSLTLQSGYQYYQSQGFQNKNTGGDVIRIVLTKFFRLIAHDKEFRENFIVAFPIHDECDCYVKKDYLFKGFYKLKEIMTLRPANWKSPLKVEIGVGRSWGDCLDVVGVTRDNKLIIEGINDEEELPKLNLDVRGLPHDTPEERDKENLRILSEHNGTDEYELRKIGLIK